MANVDLAHLDSAHLNRAPQSPELPLLDYDQLAETTAVVGLPLESLVAEMLGPYQEDGAVCLDRIQQAIHRQDGAALGSAAHALRSMSLTVGAMALADLCRILEQTGMAMTDAERSRWLARIEQTFHQVIAALSAVVSGHPHHV